MIIVWTALMAAWIGTLFVIARVADKRRARVKAYREARRVESRRAYQEEIDRLRASNQRTHERALRAASDFKLGRYAR